MIRLVLAPMLGVMLVLGRRSKIEHAQIADVFVAKHCAFSMYPHLSMTMTFMTNISYSDRAQSLFSLFRQLFLQKPSLML